jgi:hypothetical protein
MNLPVVVPDREPLTELEARQIGDSAYRLAKLRNMLKDGGRFDLTAIQPLQWGGTSSIGHQLTKLEGEAVLALLIERETLFLASFNVAVQP